MIYKILLSIVQQLNDYLKLYFKLSEDIVFISLPKDTTNSYSANRVSVFTVNIERESAGGISFNRQTVSETTFSKTAPSWQLNLYLMIAVVFTEKQYKESLQIISGVLSFVQKNNLLSIQNESVSYSIEPVNLSFQELSNLWSVMGGSYYPSLLCKVRMITIDEQEIIDLSTIIGQQNIDSGLKK